MSTKSFVPFTLETELPSCFKELVVSEDAFHYLAEELLTDMDLEFTSVYTVFTSKSITFLSSEVYYPVSLLIHIYYSLMCTENISQKAG